ncbi:MAG: hypothetical protein WA728_37450 [Xanthobacteraceae bacterium]
MPNDSVAAVLDQFVDLMDVSLERFPALTRSAENEFEQVASINAVLSTTLDEVKDSRLQWRQSNAEAYFRQRLTAVRAMPHQFLVHLF